MWWSILGRELTHNEVVGLGEAYDLHDTKGDLSWACTGLRGGCHSVSIGRSIVVSGGLQDPAECGG